MGINKPFFSVVIPCFDAWEYIDKVIVNLKEQTFLDYEIIIVDDSGKSHCEYIKDFENVRLITHEKNMGPGPARNSGIDAAKGEYILFFDPDDEYEKNLLSICYERINEANPDLVVYSLFEEYTTKQEGKKQIYIHKRPDSDLKKATDIHKEVACLEKETMLGYPWNKAYRLSLLREKNIRFQDIKHIEDILFNIDVMEHVSSLSVVSTPLYHYNNGGSDGITAGFLEDYFKLQKLRITAFLDQQKRWKSADSYVKETAAALYFRSFVSKMERDYCIKKPQSDIFNEAAEEINTELFLELKDYLGGSKIALMLYKPLTKGNIKSTFDRVRLIHFIKHNFGGIYNRLKQNR